MAAINAFQALNSYQRYNSMFSITKGPISSDGPSKPLSFSFARYASLLFSTTAANGLTNILTSANQLNNTLSSLRNNGSASLLTNRIVASSDPVSVKANAAKGADFHDVQINVQSIATAQSNSGGAFNDSAPTSLQTGTQKFTITMGNKSTPISFYANATDTHRIALGKMKDAINASDSGVSAKIVTDPVTSRIHLDLSSKDTGTNHAFSMSDVIGGAVSYSGSNSVSNAAANALYRVNSGAPQSSYSNEIQLEHGKITATLLKATAVNVSLSSKPDAAAIVKQTKQLVQDYNSLQTTISNESGYLNHQVKRSLQNSLDSDALETLGLSKQANGTLSLNEDKLKDSINNHYDQVIRSFNGSNGLASALSKATNRLQSSPSESLLNQNNSEYKRYNNYQATLQLYSQLPTSGLLLNNYL